jgi:hypothetical protein
LLAYHWFSRLNTPEKKLIMPRNLELALEEFSGTYIDMATSPFKVLLIADLPLCCDGCKKVDVRLSPSGLAYGHLIFEEWVGVEIRTLLFLEGFGRNSTSFETAEIE